MSILKKLREQNKNNNQDQETLASKGKHYNFLRFLQKAYSDLNMQKRVPLVMQKQNQILQNIFRDGFKPATSLAVMYYETLYLAIAKEYNNYNVSQEDILKFSSFITDIDSYNRNSEAAILPFSTEKAVNDYFAEYGKEEEDKNSVDRLKNHIIKVMENASKYLTLFPFVYSYLFRQKIHEFNKDLGNELLSREFSGKLDYYSFESKGFYSAFIDVRNLDTNLYNTFVQGNNLEDKYKYEYVSFRLDSGTHGAENLDANETYVEKNVSLMITIYCANGDLVPTVYILDKDIEENNEYLQSKKSKESFTEIKNSYRFINLLLYLLSENAEMRTEQTQSDKGRHYNVKQMQGKLDISNRPQIVKVGEQVGERIANAYRKVKEAENSSVHSPIRPHIRSAHYHQFWKGSKKDGADGKGRHLITHFIETTFVNM